MDIDLHWDAVRSSIAMIRARDRIEQDTFVPWIATNVDGTVTLNPEYPHLLAALIEVSRELAVMIDEDLLDAYWARKIAQSLQADAANAGG